MQTRDGQPVQIISNDKPGMSVFRVFGLLAGAPCHWTGEGRYRMDGQPDPRDLVPSPYKEGTGGEF